MARKRAASTLHLLTVREVQTAAEGDHSDGGGLLLRVRANDASWVLRYASASRRRREMGLGPARLANAAQTGDSIKTARDLAHEARRLLQQGIDPIDDREKARVAARAAERKQKESKARERLTLPRAVRAYHERAIEPRLSTKHAAQRIARLENHVPSDIRHARIAMIEAPALLVAPTKVRSLESSDQRVPETLQRIRQRLDSVLEDAIFHGDCMRTRPLRFAARSHVDEPALVRAHRHEPVASMRRAKPASRRRRATVGRRARRLRRVARLSGSRERARPVGRRKGAVGVQDDPLRAAPQVVDPANGGVAPAARGQALQFSEFKSSFRIAGGLIDDNELVRLPEKSLAHFCRNNLIRGQIVDRVIQRSHPLS